jgi:hypothetical protein
MAAPSKAVCALMNSAFRDMHEERLPGEDEM